MEAFPGGGCTMVAIPLVQRGWEVPRDFNAF